MKGSRGVAIRPDGKGRRGDRSHEGHRTRIARALARQAPGRPFPAARATECQQVAKALDNEFAQAR